MLRKNTGQDADDGTGAGLSRGGRVSFWILMLFFCWLLGGMINW